MLSPLCHLDFVQAGDMIYCPYFSFVPFVTLWLAFQAKAKRGPLFSTPCQARAAAITVSSCMPGGAP